MYAAKCLTVLVVVIGLGIMWVLARKNANQITLAIAATILVGGTLRLFQLKDGEGSIYTVGAILAAMGLIWIFSWYSNRAAQKRRAALAESAPTTLGDPSERSLLRPMATKPTRKPPRSKSEALGRAFGKMLK